MSIASAGSSRRPAIPAGRSSVGVHHETAGHVPQALAALREGESLQRQAAAKVESYAEEHVHWTAAYQRLVLLAGDEGLDTPGDHLTLAYLLHARKEYPAAVEQFASALADGRICSDLARGNLYNAACAAALGDLPEQAIEWLTEDLRLRRAELLNLRTRMARESDPAAAKSLGRRAEALEAHLEHARVNDPDLESLRANSEFAALFE